MRLWQEGRPINLTLDEPEQDLHEDGDEAESDIVNST